jgi:hypothetical protein
MIALNYEYDSNPQYRVYTNLVSVIDELQQIVTKQSILIDELREQLKPKSTAPVVKK